MIPLYITITVSLKPQTDLSSYWTFPKIPRFANFSDAFMIGHILLGYINTIIITIFSTLGVLFVGTMAAYPLARNPSWFNRGVKTSFLSIMMIPGLSLLVPLYLLLIRIKGVNQYWGIVVVHITFFLPLVVFTCSNFINTIPRELDEAALIDGCSIYTIFLRIIVPLLVPIIITIIILTSVPVWNDYQYSLFFLQRSSMQVVTLAISTFFAQNGSDPHIAAAAALIVVLPIIILYVILQKYFIKGMVEGAIK
jgi:raffinose/stachyose/melibiose transport system permease protein